MAFPQSVKDAAYRRAVADANARAQRVFTPVVVPARWLPDGKRTQSLAIGRRFRHLG